jgi:outer membrane biosynthesis protein TonB
MPLKTTALAFSVSLAAHLLFVASFDPFLWENKEPNDRLVEVSYVHYAPKTPPAYQQINYAPIARNQDKIKKPKLDAIQVSRVPEDHREASPTSVLSPRPDSFKVRNSEEFLADPGKGKVFLNYFGLIKQRVRRAVEKKYPGERLGRGDVSLLFVLKSDGAVVNVSAVEKDSSADELMKDFAVRCVKECSPFPRFPKELGMDRISFNLSILFDEST